MRISTGVGDGGQTSLTGGQRVSKNSSRVVAYGTIDELSSLIGIIVAETSCRIFAQSLVKIQQDLFELGTDLSTPSTCTELNTAFRIGSSHIEFLDKNIDQISAQLPELREFVLPGGSRSAAWLHLARTVTRRAERAVVAIVDDQSESINTDCLTYLNRLSDLFFLWARKENDLGGNDITWSH